MSVAKVGKRGALVLPAGIRKKCNIAEGDELIINACDSGVIYMVPRPHDYVKALKEAGNGLWSNEDPVSYIRKEREKWE